MSASSSLKEPEWLVFVRAVLIGTVLAEICRIAFLSSTGWGSKLIDDGLMGLAIAGGGFTVAVIGAYAYQRDAHHQVRKFLASGRYELAILAVAGAVIDELLASQLATFHQYVSRLNSGLSQAILAILLIILAATLLRPHLRRDRLNPTQLHFVSDVEIDDPGQDVLNVAHQASEFADTVLTSAATSGMVFGLDGPWGVGKTSFINIAMKRWADAASNEVIVFRFEPMRYASEPDLSERFIRDLCAKIQQEVFAPEFLPAANRYSRMLKGKTDVSILGIKLTLEPSSETVDELLGDIDALLEQMGRRLIVIIDDLDRLEPKLVNNVLFTVRRTFKLRHATYILCYDTELLVAGKDEGGRARDFLEKFITAKISLFVDLQAVKDFLVKDWHADPAHFQTISSDVMLKLRQLTSEAGVLISGPQAHHYAPMLGNLRKVKRFVNAMLLMNLEKTDLGRSDFHHADLIHLVLLHLCYPGMFRRIYAEETEGRTGSFSIRRSGGSNKHGLENAEEFEQIVKDAPAPAQFLLRALFDEATLKIPSNVPSDDGVWRTRACFNHGTRNLENYLQLIVRLKVPAATTTFRMYQDLLDEIINNGVAVGDILARPEFTARNSEDVHDQFWRVLVNNAHRLSRRAATDAIDALVESLPLYSTLAPGDRSMRQRSIYSLVLILDRAGFGELPRDGRVRPLIDVVEIADRILGTAQQVASPTPSLIQQMAAPTRGALGWEDLMVFRLTCCMDRMGQLQNIYSALLRHEDRDAIVSGDVSMLTRNSMRRFSQQVFVEFRKRYIDGKVNFFIDVDAISNAAILGEYGLASQDDAGVEGDIHAARSVIKTFVIFQLVNRHTGNGSGIGCGIYDEIGTEDGGDIYRSMCEYLFGFCFNPDFGLAHARAFADYCLRAFRDVMIERMEELNALDMHATQGALTRLLGEEQTKKFWASSGQRIKTMLADQQGTVISLHYKATYAERLPLAFEALDRLLDDTPALANA